MRFMWRGELVFASLDPVSMKMRFMQDGELRCAKWDPVTERPIFAEDRKKKKMKMPEISKDRRITRSALKKPQQLGNPPPMNRRITRSTFKKLQQLGNPPRLLSGVDAPRPSSATAEEREKDIVPKTKTVRQFTAEERSAYYAKIGKSGGYDVGDFSPDVWFRGIIRPVWKQEDPADPYYENMANQAITWFNKKHKKLYWFVKLIRVNFTGHPMHILYFITFEAETSGYRSQNFQSKLVKHYSLESEQHVLEVVCCRVEKKSKDVKGPWKHAYVIQD